MSNMQYTPEAQKSINTAENKLTDAIAALKGEKSLPEVEVAPRNNAEVEVEIPGEPATSSAVKDTKLQPPKEPRRSEFVEINDPKVKARIDDLYGQVKKSDARNQMILEHNKQLEERLSEYAERVNKMERSTKDTASDKVETELKTRLREARETADFDTVQDIEDKLLDLRLERRLTDKLHTQPQEKKPEVPKNPMQQQYEQQLINHAAYVENLATEKDQHGNLKRPYLYDWHPENRRAVEFFESIPKEYAAAGKQVDIAALMETLDERMGIKTKPMGRAEVLGGDNNDSPARNVVKLTQDELYVAQRMGLKPEAYARQKQLLNR